MKFRFCCNFGGGGVGDSRAEWIAHFGIDAGECVVESNAQCYVIGNVEALSQPEEREARNHEYAKSQSPTFCKPQRNESAKIAHTSFSRTLWVECLARV